MTKLLNTYQALETFEWSIPSDEEKSKNYSKIKNELTAKKRRDDDDDKARDISIKTSNEKKRYICIFFRLFWGLFSIDQVVLHKSIGTFLE